MKTRLFLLLWLMGPLSAGLFAQSGQAFIDEYVRQNMAHYNTLKSFQGDMTMNMMGMQVPAHQIQEFDGGMRIEIEMYGAKMIQVYDGENGWLKMGPQPAIPMPEDQLRQMRAQRAQSRPDNWVAFINDETKYLGTDNSHGFSAHKLQVSLSEEYVKEYLGNPALEGYSLKTVTLFVEDGTYYTRGVEFELFTDTDKLHSSIFLHDWKVVDGIPFPHKMEIKMQLLGNSSAGTGTIPPVEVVYSNVQFNAPIPAGSFSKPE